MAVTPSNFTGNQKSFTVRQSSKVWHVLTRDHTVLPATTRLSTGGMNRTYLYSPTAEHHRTLAGTHFPSRWGQEAKLAWVVWWNTEVFYPPKTITHPSTNWARRRVTLLIRPTMLPLRRSVGKLVMRRVTARHTDGRGHWPLYISRLLRLTRYIITALSSHTQDLRRILHLSARQWCPGAPIARDSPPSYACNFAKCSPFKKYYLLQTHRQIISKQ